MFKFQSRSYTNSNGECKVEYKNFDGEKWSGDSYRYNETDLIEYIKSLSNKEIDELCTKVLGVPNEETCADDAYYQYVNNTFEDFYKFLKTFDPECCTDTKVYNKVAKLYKDIGAALDEYNALEGCDGIINIKKISI